MSVNEENQTKWQEAARCPKCKNPGKDLGPRPGRRPGVKVHTIRCEANELCPWYMTTWVIQVNEDGSIPEAYSALGPKQYLPISNESMSRIEDAINKQLEAETRGDGEIRNPHSGR